MLDLKEIRKEIDEVDQALLKLLEKRIALSKEVADFKIHTGKKVLDQERENQKIARIKEEVAKEENADDIVKFFEQIMQDSRKIQYRELEDKAESGLEIFTSVDSIPKKDVKVAFQGVEGAYSYIAMRRFFGEEIESFSRPTWREAIEDVVNGQADYAVLPIENSTAGSVVEVYDLLNEYPVYICAEQYVEIEHALLALPGARLEDIKKVYSHPQALFQCDGFFRQNPNIDKEKTSNTAASAKLVKELGDKSLAAIASVEAAALYGLDILKEKVNDVSGNTTRFVIVSKNRVFVKGANKISVIIETPNEKGTLYKLLSSIAYNNLDMMKIESRPIKGQNWNFKFFVDFEGNLEDKAVAYALRGMYEESKYLRLLGNY